MLKKLLDEIDLHQLDAKTRDRVEKIGGQKSVSPEDIEFVLAAKRTATKSTPATLDTIGAKLDELRREARGLRS